jgi:hypothetical protein
MDKWTNEWMDRLADGEADRWTDVRYQDGQTTRHILKIRFFNVRKGYFGISTKIS